MNRVPPGVQSVVDRSHSVVVWIGDIVVWIGVICCGVDRSHMLWCGYET